MTTHSHNQGARTLMSFTGKITGIRVIERMLIPTSWDLKIDFFSILGDNEDEDAASVESSVAFHGVSFWLTEVMDDVLVFNPKDTYAVELAKTLRNPKLTTPGLPTDDNIIKLLHSKISAIGGDYLYIMKTSLISDDGGGIQYSYVDLHDDEVVLPGIEYVGERSMYKVPWWERDTADCYDLPLEDKDRKVTELFVDKSDILSEYKEMLRKKITAASASEEDMAEKFIQKLKDLADSEDVETDVSKVIEIPNKDNK